MEKKQKFFAWLSLLLTLTIFMSPVVQAKKTTDSTSMEETTKNSMPIGIKAILPDNQFNKNVSYYYLMMKPGQKQELDLQLFNTSDKDVTAVVDLTNATTNDVGAIVYDHLDGEKDASLVIPFADIATTEREVLIPANSDVTTKISVAMPADQYKGMVLGGVNVSLSEKDYSEDGEQESGMQIQNRFKYAIAVALIENEEAVEREMELLRVFADHIAGANAFKANLQNFTPTVIEELKIEAKVYKKNSEEVVYENTAENYRMAPNSNFNFGVPLGKDRLQSGDYKMTIKAISEEGTENEKVWNFEDEFTVTPEQAKKLNDTATEVEESFFEKYKVALIVAGILGLLLVLAIIFILVKKSKKKKEEEQRKQKKKRKKRKGGKNA